MNRKKLLKGYARLFYSMRFISAAMLLSAILVLLLGAVALNSVKDGGSVRVFVGAPSLPGLVFSKAYTVMREASLKRLAEKDPDGIYSAVVVFDDYYSEEDVQELAKKESVVVEKIYLWVPGETGRAAIGVSNNDVKEAVVRAAGRAENLKGTDDYGPAENDLLRIIKGNYGIFSITIKASAEKLNKIKSSERVGLIDVKYSEKAEKAAAQRDASVYYVELPCKPDGAL